MISSLSIYQLCGTYSYYIKFDNVPYSTLPLLYMLNLPFLGRQLFFLSLVSREAGPSLPDAVYGHTLLTLPDKKTVLLMGGCLGSPCTGTEITDKVNFRFYRCHLRYSERRFKPLIFIGNCYRFGNSWMILAAGSPETI